jgi:hypothetical protein
VTNFDIQRSAKDIEQRADAIKATAAAVLELVDGLPEGETKFALTAKVEGIATNAAHIGDSARLVAAAGERQ